MDFLKANFDVAIRPQFVVAVAILRDHKGEILVACSQRLPHMDSNQGEAKAALIAVQLAPNSGPLPLILEGDSLVTILAINSPHLATNWAFAQAFADINQQLHLLPSWTALKSSRRANFYAHHIAK